MIEAQQICDLPTEVLLYIFTYLPARQLVKSRQVCHRWKYVIDGMARSDQLWRKYCRNDFEKVYKVARAKARIGMLWFNIYRSLALWPMLNHARETRDEFASAGNLNEEIQSFEVLKDGIIAVHKRARIDYYNIETLEISKRSSISGNYARYAENNDNIIIQSQHLHLFIVRKNIYNPRHETNVTFDRVKLFLLVENDVYFVNMDNEIFVCNLDNDNLSARFIKQCSEIVMCLGYTDKLHVLTFERNIYTLLGDKLVLAVELTDSTNLLQQFYNHNLLETVDWNIVYQWIYILGGHLPIGPLNEIITVKLYGDMVFVGCNWGVMRMYYKPFVDGVFDFYKAEPVRQYNFMERSDCPVLTQCPVIKIDVLESEEGHTVLVGMPKKIAVLEFAHSFKSYKSVAVMLYSDVHMVRI